MIAFRPARPLKSVSAEGNDDYGNKQSEKGDAVDPEDGHVMGDVDGVRNAGKRGISLRLDAQIVVARRDTGDHDRVVPLAFGPGTIAVLNTVLPYLPAASPGLPGILIDDPVIQLDPL